MATFSAKETSANCCPLCNGVVIPYLKLYDDRFGFPGKFHLVECQTCDHKFIQEELEPEVMNKLYTSYYPRSKFNSERFVPHKVRGKFASWLNGAMSSAFRWIPEKIRVLDIGCGFGESVAYHLARGCDAYGVEADENVRRIAEKYSFNIHIGSFDPNVFDPGFFDYVSMDQVIEHIADPILVLRGVGHVLKDGGYCVLSTPNANGWGSKFFKKKWLNWHVPYHQHFFSKKSINLLAEKSGFFVQHIETITRSEWLTYQLMHLWDFPKEGHASPFWAPHRTKQTSFGKIFRKLVLASRYTLVGHAVTRFFDSAGMGDNFLIVLRKS
jgi:SAM-dependent methyltransferase